MVYFKVLFFIDKNILLSFFQKDFIALNIYTQFLTCCQNFPMWHMQARCKATSEICNLLKVKWHFTTQYKPSGFFSNLCFWWIAWNGKEWEALVTKLNLCVHGHLHIRKLGQPSNGSCFQQPLNTISISLKLIHLHFCGTTTEPVSSAFPWNSYFYPSSFTGYAVSK